MRPSCPPERAQCPAGSALQGEPQGTAQAGLGSGSQAGHTHRLRVWPWQRQGYLLKPSGRLCPCPVRSPHRGGCPGVPPLPGPPRYLPEGLPQVAVPRDVPVVPRPRAAAAQRRAQARPAPARPQRHGRGSGQRPGKGGQRPGPPLRAKAGQRRAPTASRGRPRSLRPAPPALLPLPTARHDSSRVTGRFSLMPTNSHEATEKRMASGPRAATGAQPALPGGRRGARQLSRGFLYFCKEKE